MATTAELIQKQIDVIPTLRTLPSSEQPHFKSWKQLTDSILERKVNKTKAYQFDIRCDYWPNHIGPWDQEELKQSLNEGLDTAEAFLQTTLQEIELLGEENEDNPKSDISAAKNQQFGNITVSGGTLILGDGNKITQVAVKELVEALKEEIEEKIPESDSKKNVLTSLKEITSNETFAAVTGTVIGEILRRVTRP